MSNLTYTAQGNFNNLRKANLTVCIPAEIATGSYRTEMYNMSKNTSTGPINVIFCHFENRINTPIDHNSFDYRLNIDIDKLKSYPNAVAFDENNSDCLFIFFHNSDFESSDRAAFFTQIETIYDDVKNHGNQSQDGLNYTVNATNRTPRRVGMSLVVKTN